MPARGLRSRDDPDRLAVASPLGWALMAGRGRWQRAAHLDFLASHLHRLVRGELTTLLVSLPVRHGKTEFLSKHLPAWWLLTHPEHRVMTVSYQEALARTWSRRALADFAEHAPRLGGLSASTRASTRSWDVFRDGRRTGGGLDAVGAMGALTGRGANLLVVDDLIKGVATARNRSIRESTWEWFPSDLLTRLEPGARLLVVGTRWHHDDPMGRLERELRAGTWGESL